MSPALPVAATTIFALSSGRLPAAIAVVRISGPRAGDALKALCGRIPEPRRAALARVRDPRSGEIIDEALVLWFPAPKSETGEDVAELQLHGGRAVLAAVCEALGRLDGLRPAEAGEFTRRAFANGQLDLTEVEGLADLIGAETEAQRRQAFRHMKGLLGDKAEDWRKRLIEALALVEAGIDFADEDLPGNLMPQVRAKTQALADEIGGALDDGRRGERLRDGLVVAIAGPPNAGKSTLLNRIARRDAAIVSAIPGTTRDVIEVHLDLGGCPVTLLDTAGIRETTDPVELEGVNRARARAAAADLVLWVVDATETEPVSPPATAGAVWLVRNKADLLGEGADGGSMGGDATAEIQAVDVFTRAAADRFGSVLPSMPAEGLHSGYHSGPRSSPHSGDDRSATSPLPLSSASGLSSPLGSSPLAVLAPLSISETPRNNESIIENYILRYDISAMQGHGVDSLLNDLARRASGGSGEPALITRARHRQALTETRDALMRALEASQDDLVAEELRLAARALGRLTGRVDVEDILDIVFRDFCIGK